MTITVNGNPVYIDPEKIMSYLPVVLPIVIFFIVFGVFGAVIRSVSKSVIDVKKQFPQGTLRELQSIRSQISRGVTWQEVLDQWDIKVDRETKKITIRKKSVAGESSLSPTEMQVTQLAQLPAAMRQMIGQVQQNKSHQDSQASRPKMPTASQPSNPFVNEGVSMFIKVILGIAVLIALYTIGSYMG